MMTLSHFQPVVLAQCHAPPSTTHESPYAPPFAVCGAFARNFVRNYTYVIAAHRSRHIPTNSILDRKSPSALLLPCAWLRQRVVRNRWI